METEQSLQEKILLGWKQISIFLQYLSRSFQDILQTYCLDMLWDFPLRPVCWIYFKNFLKKMFSGVFLEFLVETRGCRSSFERTDTTTQEQWKLNVYYKTVEIGTGKSASNFSVHWLRAVLHMSIPYIYIYMYK